MNKKLIITALCVPLGYDSDDGAEYHRQGDGYEGRSFGVCQCSTIE